ncbi:hypothetical protein pb186bvf_003088 [Paramecium bursaria]
MKIQLYIFSKYAADFSAILQLLGKFENISIHQNYSQYNLKF